MIAIATWILYASRTFALHRSSSHDVWCQFGGGGDAKITTKSEQQQYKATTGAMEPMVQPSKLSRLGRAA